MERGTASELANLIKSGPQNLEHLVIDSLGVELPVRVWATARANAPLVVFFHGSVHRQSTPIPAFEGRFTATPLRRRANIISIADPALSLSPDLRSTWYAGAKGLDVPAAIRQMVADLIGQLRPRRVVFAGGSTGGHPALYQASFVPNSVAVVCNPIGIIEHYNQAHIDDYHAICWGSASEGSSSYVNDASTAYDESNNTTVIFLCNSRDLHFPMQSALLQKSIFERTRSRNVAVVSNFFSSHAGHSYPPAHWLAWIKAAVEAPTAAFSDIGEQLEANTVTQPARTPVAGKYAPADVTLAQKVVEAALSGEQ